MQQNQLKLLSNFYKISNKESTFIFKYCVSIEPEGCESFKKIIHDYSPKIAEIFRVFKLNYTDTTHILFSPTFIQEPVKIRVDCNLIEYELIIQFMNFIDPEDREYINFIGNLF